MLVYGVAEDVLIIAAMDLASNPKSKRPVTVDSTGETSQIRDVDLGPTSLGEADGENVTAYHTVSTEVRYHQLQRSADARPSNVF